MLEETSMSKSAFSIKEVAGILGISEKTVRRLIKRGELPARRVGGVWRISRDAIRQLLGAEPAA